MSFLEQLDETIKIPNVYYHRFILSYKKNTKDLYMFCEGDVDLSYYAEQIERINSEAVIHKFPAECKNNVLKIWEYIDWNNYQKNRVLFFVDRDLSYWTNEPQTYDSNVYITDGYSFENDAVSARMFMKLLEDLYGFASCSIEEKNEIEKLYDEKWNAFVEGSYDLMGYILHKYQYSNEHTAQNLDVRKCIDFGDKNIWKKMIKGMSSEAYIRSKLRVEEVASEAIQEYKKRFQEEPSHYSIRGKWSLEFMIGLMDFVLERGKKYAPSLFDGRAKVPKKIVELTNRGAMATIAPRMIPAQSLVDFLYSNIGDDNE